MAHLQFLVHTPFSETITLLYKFFDGGQGILQRTLIFPLKRRDWLFTLSQYNFIKKLLESSKGLETLVSQN